jgi:hypothetical protein
MKPMNLALQGPSNGFEGEFGQRFGELPSSFTRFDGTAFLQSYPHQPTIL